jgi:hypothetical protein
MKVVNVLQRIPTNAKKNNRRVKLHVLLTEELKIALVSLMPQTWMVSESEVFLECFHETATFTLLAHGCWLRSRHLLTPAGCPSTPPVWVWQQECHTSDQVHVYDEFPAMTSEDEIKRCMADRLPELLADDQPLLRLCPRFLARFVTVRCHLPGSAVWIDRSFFDESGAQTYDVCTAFHDEHGNDLLDWSEAITAAPTKIVEYLRRFQPVLYEQVARRNTTQEASPSQDPIAMASAELTVEISTLERPSSALGEDELPRPTAAQLAQVRDPREAVWQARCEEHDRKLDLIVDEHRERLSQSPAYSGKWVVLTEESCLTPLHVADTKLEALKWKASTWAELKLQGTPAFIFLAAMD